LLGTGETGTDMKAIPGVLNDNISSHTYAYMSIGTYSNYLNQIKCALNAGTPAVIDITATGNEGWPYSTEGHFININGLLDTTASDSICVTDPWTLGLGSHWYDASLVYTVNNNHSRQAIIW
jgi:hypothetical protein